MTSTPQRVGAARQRAFDDAAALVLAPDDGQPRHTRLAVGDPQAPLDTFLQVLDAHRLLSDEGRLLPHVGLVSMGDHFDWGEPSQREQATREGTALLSWLAAHPPDQVQIILGNHDLIRVGELSDFSDEAFRVARAEADAAYRLGDVDETREEAFLARTPAMPNAQALARNFSCFDTAQRVLVTRLLLAKRARLAAASAVDLLLVHAGVTEADLEDLRVAGRDAFTCAAALNTFLDSRVERWGGKGPLDLAPLHQLGSASTGAAQGILFHRPANPAVGPVSRQERRFDPRTLPRHITQAIGHINDKKCRELLGPWAKPGAPAFGRLRGLRLEGDRVQYRVGCNARDALVFLDGAMNHVAPNSYELFDLCLRGVATK